MADFNFLTVNTTKSTICGDGARKKDRNQFPFEPHRNEDSNWSDFKRIWKRKFENDKNHTLNINHCQDILLMGQNYSFTIL